MLPIKISFSGDLSPPSSSTCQVTHNFTHDLDIEELETMANHDEFNKYMIHREFIVPGTGRSASVLLRNLKCDHIRSYHPAGYFCRDCQWSAEMKIQQIFMSDLQTLPHQFKNASWINRAAILDRCFFVRWS